MYIGLFCKTNSQTGTSVEAETQTPTITQPESEPGIEAQPEVVVNAPLDVENVPPFPLPEGVPNAQEITPETEKKILEALQLMWEKLVIDFKNGKLISVEEAVPISINFIRDFVWSVFSFLTLGPSFRTTSNFLYESLGQLLGSSIAVLTSAPLLAGIWSKVYNRSYWTCFAYAGVASVSCLSAIFPWNYFSKLGFDFFTNRGVNANAAGWLSSIFPGPGAAEGPTQTIVTALLLSFIVGKFNLVDAEFKFNFFGLILGLLPIAYIPGDVWQVSYLSVNGLAEESIAGVLLQGLVVAAATGLANLTTIKLIEFLSDFLAKKCAESETLQKVVHSEKGQRIMRFFTSCLSTQTTNEAQVENNAVPNIVAAA